MIIGSAAMGGGVWPNSQNWPMEHVSISMDGTDLHAHANTNASNRIELNRFAGEEYSGGAGVLTDTYYSDQYGWVADGFIDPGAGNGIWIERVGSTLGLDAYEGGMRMMRENHTYDAIFGTAGSDDAWQWSGMMTHNWYSASVLGEYEASYRIFVGDQFGDAVAGFGEASVTLYFDAVPTPGGAALFGFAGLAGMRRKRGES